MRKSYMIYCLELQEYALPGTHETVFALERFTENVKRAGTWPSIESTEYWMADLPEGFHYTIIETYYSIK